MGVSAPRKALSIEPRQAENAKRWSKKCLKIKTNDWDELPGLFVA